MHFHPSYVFFLLVSTCGAEVLPLRDIAARVHAGNPDLSAARLRIEEARGRLRQSGRLTNPELEVEFARNTMGREGSFSVALMQRFPLTAKLAHEKAASRAQFAAAESEIRNVERKLIAQAEALGIKLRSVRNQRELRERQIANSKELATFLLKRVETGEAPAIDASLVELETRQLEIERLQLGAEEAGMVGELRPLIGLSGSESVTLTGELSLPTNGVRELNDVEARPDVEAARQQTLAARETLQRERASRWEDVGIGAMWERDRTKDDPGPTETENMIGLKLSVPLPVWNTNAGRIQEAAAAAERARREADAVVVNANAEVNAARGEMGALRKLLDELDSSLLPKAREIEQRQRQLYSSAQTPLTEVLRARNKQLDLERQRLDALRDYHLARVRLRAAAGKNFPPANSR